MIRLSVALLVACCAFAQDSALERLKQELKVARERDQSEEEAAQKTGNWDAHRAHQAERIMRLHALFLDWIEQQLPKGPSAAAVKSSDWESAMEKLLNPNASDEKGAVTQPDPDDYPPSLGSLDVHLAWRAELPQILFVVATVGVPCGGDQAVYGYRFDANGRARVISDHPPGTGYEQLRLISPTPILKDNGCSSFDGTQVNVSRPGWERPIRFSG